MEPQKPHIISVEKQKQNNNCYFINIDKPGIGGVPNLKHSLLNGSLHYFYFLIKFFVLLFIVVSHA